MFKNIISPVQAWLISQGRCVGCGTPLPKGIRKGNKSNESFVTCKKCGRVFLYNFTAMAYRRAPIEKNK